MRKGLVILLLVVGMIQSSPAQQCFNKRDALHSFSSVLTSAVQLGNKYYCAGTCWDSINYIGNGQAKGIQGVKFAVFDSNGNKLRDTVYQNSGGKSIWAWLGKLVPQPDYTFLLAADEVDTSGNYYLNIMRFDTTGKLIWEKEYSKPTCLPVNKDFWRLVDFKPDGYGNWLLLSTINCQSGNASQTDWLLMKLDNSFNMIWFKQYGNSNLTDIASKIVAEPDGYLLTGGVNNNNITSLGFSYRAQIIKTDTSGNVKWLWQSNSSKKTNSIKDIIRTQDGGYVYCGQGDGYEYVNGPYGYMRWKGWVEKLDSNRNVVWSKSFNNYYFSEFNIIQETLDGRLLLFGNKYWPDEISPDYWDKHTKGWFLTLSANGDSLRERRYSFMNTCDDYHGIFDVKNTFDGGFIMVGESRDNCFPYVPPTQRGWLVKVDSNGCLGPGDPQCWPTSINEVSNEKKIMVYPNPVTDYCYISNKDGKSLTVIISDIAGRVLQEANSSALSVQLNMQQYSPGIYFYRIIGKEGLLLQGKQVKE